MKKGLMTEGSIAKQILFFSIPLLIGNMFQLLYNTIDSLVVGRYVGKVALAAVGASSPLINLLVSFFMGLSVGAGVIISRYFGAKKDDDLKQSTHTFVVFSFVCGVVLSVFGIFFSKYFLVMMKTPVDVLQSASEYLEIYFLGSIFVCLYNAGTGILQSVGDSKRPLYFLGISSIINIVLDLIFVRNFNMGVVGVALATFIAQAVSCILIMFVLFKSKENYGLDFKNLKINFFVLKDIIRIGIPAGLQGVIVSYSNVVVQAYVNNFGSAAIAGFSSATKFDNFLALPVNSFALAITTFSGQNLGSKLYDRVRHGVNITLAMSISIVVFLGIFVIIFADNCIMLFSNDIDVIKNGAQFIRIMCPFYIALCVHQVYSGALRASGRSVIPMVISVLCFVFIRQIFLSVFMNIYKNMAIVGFGYSVTWTLAGIISFIYYHTSKWIEKDVNML